MSHWPEDNQSILKGEEFDKRCHEVFVDNETEIVYCGIIVDRDGWATIYGTEFSGQEDSENYPFSTDYVVNMTDRPHALAYLLGKRDNFDD